MVFLYWECYTFGLRFVTVLFYTKQNVELGHKKKFEFWRMRDWAEALGMTQAEFNDFMNNSDFYGWQDIASNRSHAYEQH